MYGKKQVALNSQRGLSLTGLIVILGVIAMVAMLGLKVFPLIMEYQAAKAGIVAAKNARDVRPQTAFQKAIDLNNITSLAAKDLIVYKTQAGTEVAFDYEARVELFKDVSLVLHFAATTDPSGVIPEKKPEER
jgi:hypothetical protein